MYGKARPYVPWLNTRWLGQDLEDLGLHGSKKGNAFDPWFNWQEHDGITGFERQKIWKLFVIHTHHTLSPSSGDRARRM